MVRYDFGGKVVLVSGDEEYRSEETLPQLGKILAKRHGFRCTVLFAIDKKTGAINPNQNDNIPGLEALDDADLLVLFTRFRNLPDEQMQHLADYIQSGRPIVATRIATHTQLLDDLLAFLVEPTSEALAAGVRQALEHKDDAHARAERGLALVEREYSVERYREKIAKAYKEVERRALGGAGASA